MLKRKNSRSKLNQRGQSKEIEEVNLTGQIVEVDGRMYKVSIGKKEGLRLDDGFHIAEFYEDKDGETANAIGNNTYPNNDPEITILTLNIPTQTNNSYQDISCNVTITDNDPEDNLSANFTWYKNGVENLG